MPMSSVKLTNAKSDDITSVNHPTVPCIRFLDSTGRQRDILHNDI